MGITSTLMMPALGQQIQQSQNMLNNSQMISQLTSIQDPNARNAMWNMFWAQNETNKALWTLAQGLHPIVSKEVEEGPNNPGISVLA